jgi:hypothetical protein
VFFRSEHAAMAIYLLQTMFVPTPGLLVEHVNSFLLMLGMAITWGMFGPNAFDWHASFHWQPRYAYALTAAFGMVIAVMLGGHYSPFLYFQF